MLSLDPAKENRKPNVQSKPGSKPQQRQPLAPKSISDSRPAEDDTSSKIKSNDVTKENGKAEKNEQSIRWSEVADYTGDDPLSPWINYINWCTQHLPSSALLPILSQCTKSLQSHSQYQNSPRYLKLWIQLANLSSDPISIFADLQHRKIGTGLALFYQAYALVLEQACQYEESDKIYMAGLLAQADPLVTLISCYDKFKTRLQSVNGSVLPPTSSKKRGNGTPASAVREESAKSFKMASSTSASNSWPPGGSALSSHAQPSDAGGCNLGYTPALFLNGTQELSFEEVRARKYLQRARDIPSLTSVIRSISSSSPDNSNNPVTPSNTSLSKMNAALLQFLNNMGTNSVSPSPASPAGSPLLLPSAGLKFLPESSPTRFTKAAMDDIDAMFHDPTQMFFPSSSSSLVPVGASSHASNAASTYSSSLSGLTVSSQDLGDDGYTTKSLTSELSIMASKPGSPPKRSRHSPVAFAIHEDTDILLREKIENHEEEKEKSEGEDDDEDDETDNVVSFGNSNQLNKSSSSIHFSIHEDTELIQKPKSSFAVFDGNTTTTSSKSSRRKSIQPAVVRHEEEEEYEEDDDNVVQFQQNPKNNPISADKRKLHPNPNPTPTVAYRPSTTSSNNNRTPVSSSSTLSSISMGSLSPCEDSYPFAQSNTRTFSLPSATTLYLTPIEEVSRESDGSNLSVYSTTTGPIEIGRMSSVSMASNITNQFTQHQQGDSQNNSAAPPPPNSLVGANSTSTAASSSSNRPSFSARRSIGMINSGRVPASNDDVQDTIDPLAPELHQLILNALNIQNYPSVHLHTEAFPLPPLLEGDTTDMDLNEDWLQVRERRQEEEEAGTNVFLVTHMENDSELIMHLLSPATLWPFYISTTLRDRLLQFNEKLINNYQLPATVHSYSNLSLFLSPHNQTEMISLKSLLNKYTESSTPIDDILAVWYGLELLRSIRTLHSCGIVHSNINTHTIHIALPDTSVGDWSPKIRSNGWENAGVILSHWSAAIDLWSYSAGVSFTTQHMPNDITCIQHQQGQPWCEHVDLYSYVRIMYRIVYGVEMKISKSDHSQWKYRAKGGQLHSNAWVDKIWSSVFDRLLNSQPPLTAVSAANENEYVVSASLNLLSQILGELESCLGEEDKWKQLKVSLCKQNVM